MASLAQSPLPAVHPSELECQVRAALDEPEARLLRVQCDTLGGAELDSTVYRVHGNAQAPAGEKAWSLILKIIRSRPDNLGEQGIWYWKREALAYQSGFLSSLPPGISAPRCYQVIEEPGQIRLWLEYLDEDSAPEWSVEQYARAAHHLARFNGAFLADQPLPEQPWIPRSWLRKYVEHAAPMIAAMRKRPPHPAIQQMFPGTSGRILLAIWEERDRLFRLLDSYPQTFCHQDAYRLNLFSVRGQTYAIDWSYLGCAPLGAEITPLIFASMGIASPGLFAKAKELDRFVFQSYLEGLSEAGWNGQPEDVRLVYDIILVFRYMIGALIGEVLPAVVDAEQERERVEKYKAQEKKEFERYAIERTRLLNEYVAGILQETTRLLGARRMAGMAARTGMRVLQGKV